MSIQNSAAQLKRAVGQAAAEKVHSGTCIGLGSGSTAAQAIEAIGLRLQAGEIEEVIGVATSNQASLEADKAGISLVTTDQVDRIDLVIDGADEVSPGGVLLKGGGGAQVLEKIIATMAHSFIVVIDNSKLAKKVGVLAPVSVEVIPEALPLAMQRLQALGGDPIIRMRQKRGIPSITDRRNLLVDTWFDAIPDPGLLGEKIDSIPGVLGNGIFSDLADTILVAETREEEIFIYDYLE